MRSCRPYSLICFLLFLGCTDSFETKIAESRKAGLSKVAIPGEGLPFFRAGYLDPVWDRSQDLARIDQFAMTDHRGKLHDESLFRKKPTFVAFFYASCGGFCPLLIRNLKRIERKLSRLGLARFVAVSVAPEADTVEYLSKYAEQNIAEANESNWFLLTGDYSQVRYLADEVFSVEAFKKLEKGRIVHTERIFLLDQEGFLRAVFNGTKKDLPEMADRAIRKLQPPLVSKAN